MCIDKTFHKIFTGQKTNGTLLYNFVSILSVAFFMLNYSKLNIKKILIIWIRTFIKGITASSWILTDLSRFISLLIRRICNVKPRACGDDGHRVYFWRNVKWHNKYFLKRLREVHLNPPQKGRISRDLKVANRRFFVFICLSKFLPALSREGKLYTKLQLPLLTHYGNIYFLSEELTLI